MKKVLLLLIVLGACLQFAAAQTCIPDTTLADTVIVYPLPYQEDVEGTGIMDTACVNTYFETVLQFKIPPEFATPIGTFQVKSVDLATEGAVQNAPPSFDYVCNPPNCVFQKDSTGCIVMYGTAAGGEEGVYDLQVAVTIRTNVADFNYVLPDGEIVQGNYYLTVKPAGSENCTTVDTRDYLQQYLSHRAVPNPFGDYTEIRINSQLTDNFSFEVYNLLGQLVHRRSVRLFEGPNIIPFEANGLSNGMYQYVIRNYDGAISGKMMLSRGE